MKLTSHLCATTLLSAATAWIFLPFVALANPEGGVVVSGAATITESGKKLDIHQSTDRAVIDWRGFDIAPDEHTQFYQPGSGSIALNRVNSSSASQIYGQLTANGNVVIINQNGVLFGSGARVDVNGLIATTADTDNARFMAGGALSFDKPGNPAASIINQGSITAKEAGLVGLVAPNVMNSGIISARLGRVHLASGDTMAVDLYGDGLMNVAVSDNVKSQLVHNTGVIEAAGGTIALTAAAGGQMVNSLVKVSGELHAPTVGMRNGKIIIAAEGSNAVKGNITADKGKKLGSSTVVVGNALLNASGRNAGERGGSITVTGDNVALLSGTILDASGHTGLSGTTAGLEKSAYRIGSAGGDIRIGGDYLGGGDTMTTQNLYVDAGVLVLNDALMTGDAGRTIFWSDGNTAFYGNVYARALGGQAVDPLSWSATAGGNSGDGGFVETSGHRHLDAGGYVDLTASNGARGTYFLDPTDITIYGNVDPAFQSTDGSINLATSLKLWLDAADTSKVVLTYSVDGLSSATATGTSGTNTITTSANVAASLAVGARIRLGSAGSVTAASTLGADTYTIASISGTTITLTSNLTQNYTTSTLYRGLVSELTDKSGQASNATQATAANMPLWISNGQNGLGVAKFDGINDYLSGSVTSGLGGNASKSIFSAARPDAITTFDNIWGMGADGSSGSSFGLGLRNNSKVTLYQWGALDLDGSTTQTNAAWNLWGGIKSGDSLSVYSRGLLDGSGTYSSANITDQTYKLGAFNAGTYNSGGSFSGPIADTIIYNTALSTNSRNLIEQYQSARYSIALTPPGTGADEVAKATAADGYSVFTTRYLERLSQTADISLQATNNITLDLKGDTMALASNRNFTLTAGNNIASASAGTITTSGTGNILFTAGNDINFAHALNLTASGTGSLTLRANNNILNTGASTHTTQGGAITFNSDRDASGLGAIHLGTATVNSNGGNITFGGGLDPLTGYAVANADYTVAGVRISNVNAAGGNIVANGQGYGNAVCNNNCWGVQATVGSTIQTNGNGTITLNGIGGGTSASANNAALRLFGTIRAVNGDITMMGRSVDSSASLSIAAVTMETLGTGNITLYSNPVNINQGGLSFWAAASTITSGGNFTYVGNKFPTNGTLPTITAAGDIIIRPYDAGTTVGVGSTAAALRIQDDWLAIMNWGGNLWLGGYGNPGNPGYVSNAGAMTINSAFTFAKNVNFLSASGITHSGTGLTASGTANMMLNAGTGTITSNAISMGTGNLTLTADDLVLGGNLSGTGTLTLQPSSTNRIVRLADGATDFNLSSAELGYLVDGWSTINIGRDDSAANMQISQANWSDPVVFRSNAAKQLNVDLVGTGNASFTFYNGWTDMYRNITTNGGDVRVVTNRLDSADAFVDAGRVYSFGNSITTNGGSVVLQRYIAASGTSAITTSGGAITFQTLIDQTYRTSDNTLNLDAGSGTISFGGTVDGVFGGGKLNLTALAGNFTFGGDWGARGGPNFPLLGNISLTSTNTSFTAPNITASGNVSLNAGTGTITTGTITTGAGNLTLTADDLVLGGNLSGTGTLTLQPTTPGQALNLNGLAGGFNLDATELTRLVDGWSGITIGRSNATGLATLGAATFYDPLTLRAGSINVTGNFQPTALGNVYAYTGDINFNAPVNYAAPSGTLTYYSYGDINVNQTYSQTQGGGWPRLAFRANLGPTGNININADVYAREGFDFIARNDINVNARLTSGTAYFGSLWAANGDVNGTGWLTMGPGGILSSGTTGYSLRSGLKAGARKDITFDATRFTATGVGTMSVLGFNDITLDRTFRLGNGDTSINAYGKLTINQLIQDDHGDGLSLTAANGIYLNANITRLASTSGGRFFNFNSDVILGNDVTIDAHSSAMATITFGGTINGDGVTPRSLTLLASGGTATFNGAVGNTVPLGALNVTAASTVVKNNITTNNANITMNAPVTITGGPSIWNAGTATITTGSTVSAGANNLTLTADDLAIGGNLSGTGTLTLQPGSTNRNIRINNGSNDGLALHLSTQELGYLVDGWSQINIGRSDSTAGIDAGNASFSDPLNFRSRILALWGGVSGTDNASITFSGNGVAYADLRASGSITTAGRAITFTNAYINADGGSLSSNGGDITIGQSYYMRSGSSFSIQSGNGAISLQAIIQSASMAGKTLSINAGTGSISFGSTVNTDVNLTASAGSFTFNGAWGGTTPLGNVSLTSTNTSFTMPNLTSTGNVSLNAGTGTITTGAIATGAGNLTLTADDLAIGGNLSGTGVLSLTPASISRPINVNYGTDNGTSLHLSTTEIAAFVNGWNLINVGTSTSYNSSGVMNIGASTWYDPVAFTIGGSINVRGDVTGLDNSSFNLLNCACVGGGLNGYTLEANQGITMNLFLLGTGTLRSNAGNITVNRAMGLGYTGTTTIDAPNNTVTINSALASGNFNINGASVIFGGSTTIGSHVIGGVSGSLYGLTINTANTNLSLPSVTSTGNVSLNAGTGTITTGTIATGAGNLTLTADDLAIGGNLSGTGTLTLQPYSASRNVNVAIGTADGTNFNLSATEIGYLLDGWSGITIGNGVNSAGASGMTIGAVSFADPVHFRSGGSTNINGALVGTGNTSFTFSGFNNQYLSNTTLTTNGGNVTFNNSLVSTGGTINTNGGQLNNLGVTVISNNGGILNINTGGGNMSLASSLYGFFTNNTFNLNAGSGQIAFGNTVFSAGNLTASAGNFTFNGAWGGTTPLGNVSLTSTNTSFTMPNLTSTGNVSLNAGTGTITTGTIATGAGNLTLTADDVAIGGNLSGTGTLTLQPSSTNRIVRVNSGVDNGSSFHLGTQEIGYLVDGWNEIVIGKASYNPSGSMYVGASNWLDPVIFRSANATDIRDTISGTGNASFTFYNYNNYGGNFTIRTEGGNILFYGGNLGVQAMVIETAGGNFYTQSGLFVASGSNTIRVSTSNGNITFGHNIFNGTAGQNMIFDAGNGVLSLGGQVFTPANVTATAGSFVFNGAWGASTALGNVSLTSANALSLPSITATSIFARTTGATSDITLASGKVLTVSGGGDALTLVAGRNFINNAGAGAFNMTGAGRWLVYSTNPTDTVGEESLSSSFRRYSCSYASVGSCSGGAVSIPAGGNGLIYSYTPMLTATPDTLAALTYGDAAPNLNGYGYTLSGYLAGDTGDNVTGTLIGGTNYTQGADIGTYGITYSSGTLSSAMGYGFTYAPNANAITVNARNLAVALTGTVSKVYDGLTSATLAAGNYMLSTVFSSDNVYITNTGGSYDTDAAGTGKTVTVTGLTLGGTKAGNYLLSSNSVSGAVGEITTAVSPAAPDPIYIPASVLRTVQNPLILQPSAGGQPVNELSPQGQPLPVAGVPAVGRLLASSGPWITVNTTTPNIGQIRVEANAIRLLNVDAGMLN